MHREEGIFIDLGLCSSDSPSLFCSSTDVHTVASLLKLYIRELPEPIVPFSKYTQFLSCAQILTKDTEMVILCLGKQTAYCPGLGNPTGLIHSGFSFLPDGQPLSPSQV